MELYNEYNIWGPYKFNPKNGKTRLILSLKHKISGKRTSLSYPKYLMECHIGRYLDEHETVDHIDNDPLNNCLSNLRILTRSENSKDAAIRVKDIEVNCAWCGKTFTVKGNKIRQRERGKAGPFCSKSCSGKYGASLQNGKCKKITTSEYQKIYYIDPIE